MTSPIRADGFLRLARELADGDGRGRPRLANLRRATSTAYYALFHQILRHGSRCMVSDASEDDIANVSRWFTHAGVANAAQWVVVAAGGRPPKVAQRSAVELMRRGDATGASIPGPLLDVAQAFLQLQAARHEADYSNVYDPVRYTTRNHVRTAEQAVRQARDLWRGESKREPSRQLDAEAYRRFLLLCLTASGGPRTR